FRNDPFGGVGKPRRGDDVHAALLQQFAALFHVGAFEPSDHGHFHAHFLDRLDNALGHQVAAHDATENVDEDGAHALALENQFEGRLDPVGGGAAAHVQEDGGFATLELDQIHGGNDQASPIHNAGDVAVQAKSVQMMSG